MTADGARPRVLVTRSEDVLGERWEDYADCVREAGAEPVPYDQATWEQDGVPAAYDGLMITAGVDIDPARYGEEQSEYVREIAPDRDDFETAVLEDALARDVPVLAICRGHQLFNVAAGGSLLQHLDEREPHRARRGEGDAIDSGWHEIAIAPGSRLAAVFGERALRVNSRHHQAVTVERVPDGLDIVATTEDGVVEALERPDKRWAVSVQWHPEMGEMLPGQRPLFEAFVEACRESPAD
jgi:putative glutamine amidotransferase